jgi:hypothetical protein
LASKTCVEASTIGSSSAKDWVGFDHHLESEIKKEYTTEVWMKILIGLVHNNDPSRNAAMKETVEIIKRSLSDADILEVVSESWQPKVLSMGFSDRIRKSLANSVAHIKIMSLMANGHLPTLFSNLLNSFAVSLSSTLRDIWKSLNGDLSPARTLQLSIKHFLLWRRFNESDSDYLLVLEDDAMIFHDRIRDLPRLWSLLGANQAAADFIMVGAGYSFSELRAKRVVTETSELGIHAAVRPFSNTASGYLINRETANRFVTCVSLRPRRLNVNADFLITLLLNEGGSFRQSEGIRCLHFVPPIFDNASLLGRYKSSVS